MIKRLIKFEKHDWKHIWFLVKNMLKQFLKGDLHEAKEACIFIKIHMSYDSERVDLND